MQEFACSSQYVTCLIQLIQGQLKSKRKLIVDYKCNIKQTTNTLILKILMNPEIVLDSIKKDLVIIYYIKTENTCYMLHEM
jgi:hypothetical protein